MVSKYVNAGDKVELQAVARIKLTDGSQPAKSYRSQVYDILSEDKLELTMPMEKAKLILLPVDGEYNLYFYTENGLYQCRSRITDRYKRNNVYILAVELTSNLQRYQRRDYFRLSCALTLRTRALTRQEITAMERQESYLLEEDIPLKSAVAVDISGGGLRFVADFAYEQDSLIYSEFHLEGSGTDKTFCLVSRVLHVAEIENRKGSFEHRVQYADISTDEREEIIHFIFEEERKKLKRQKGT